MVYVRFFKGTVGTLYIVSAEMCLHMYYTTILVIVKGGVKVDFGRRTGCLLGYVQFDYGRCVVFPSYSLYLFTSVHE